MSHNRTHLKPAIITNKNGVSTTVYKKLAAEPTGNTKVPNVILPAPGTDREQLEHETAESLVNQDSAPPFTDIDEAVRAQNYQKLRAILPTYSDETLHRFAATVGTDLGWDLNDYLCNAHPDEENVNDWILIEPLAVQLGGYSAPILKGLRKYEKLTPQKDGHYPTRRTEEVIAITHVMVHLEGLGYGIDYGVNDQDFNMQYIEDAQLRELLTTHENPAAIANIITQRSITDADQITTLLDTMNTTAQAINGGAL